MPVPIAYTKPVGVSEHFDISKTQAALALQAKQKDAAKKAAVADANAKRKAAEEMLDLMNGYDLSKIPEGMQDAVQQSGTDLITQLGNFEGDNLTDMRLKIQSWHNMFNTAAAHKANEDALNARELQSSIRTDGAARRKYNEGLDQFLEVDLQGYDQHVLNSEMVWQGLDKNWKYVYDENNGYQLQFSDKLEDGTDAGMYKPFDVWEPRTSTEMFSIPEKIKHTKTFTEGGKYIQELVESKQGENGWDRGVASNLTRETVLGGDDTIGEAMRSRAFEEFFPTELKKDSTVYLPFIQGEFDNPRFQNEDGTRTEMGKVVDDILDKAVAKIVDLSKYELDPEDPTGSGEPDLYLPSMRREAVNTLQGMVVDTSDPAAANDPAAQRFGGFVSGLENTKGQVYRLPDNKLSLTGVINPYFGQVDEYGMDTGQPQKIDIKNVRNILFFPPNENYPEGVMVVRDADIDGMAANHMAFDNNDPMDKGVINQVLAHLRMQTKDTGLNFDKLADGWDQVQEDLPRSEESDEEFNPDGF